MPFHIEENQVYIELSTVFVDKIVEN